MQIKETSALFFSIYIFVSWPPTYLIDTELIHPANPA